MGFHAPQEMACILGETIDFARRDHLAARNSQREMARSSVLGSSKAGAGWPP